MRLGHPSRPLALPAPCAAPLPTPTRAPARSAFIVGELRDWASSNSGVSVSVVHGAGRHPIASGRYVDGSAKVVDLRNKAATDVATVLDALRDTATGRVRKFRQPVFSHVPSVQGVWDPSNSYEDFAMREATPENANAPTEAAATVA